MNICGCLVYVASDRSDAAVSAMKATEGVEVHAEGEDGRIIVVVEDTATRFASEIIMDLHQIPGVISLTLTYHHFEEPGDPASAPPTLRSHSTGGQHNDHI